MIDLSSTPSMLSEPENDPYSDVPGVSFHQLKALYISSQAFLAGLKPYEASDKEHFKIGTLIHEVLLTPQSAGDLIGIPEGLVSPSTDQQHAVIGRVIDHVRAGSQPDDTDVWKSSYNDFYKTGKHTNLQETYTPYVLFMLEAEGKRLVPSQTWKMLERIVAQCLSDPEINELLDDKQAVKEVPVSMVLDSGLVVKGMPDWRKPGHVMDIKSSSLPVSAFPRECSKYDYLLQLVHYANLNEGRILSPEELMEVRLEHLYVSTEGFRPYRVPYELTHRAAAVMQHRLSVLYEAAHLILANPPNNDDVWVSRAWTDIDWKTDAYSLWVSPQTLIVREYD